MAGRAARSVGKATRRTPPKAPGPGSGWPRSGQRGPGGALRKAPVPGAWCPARVPQAEGDNRPTHHTGAGFCDRAPTERTGTGRRALQGWRKPPAKPAEGLAKAAGLCNGWRAPSRRPWAAVWKEGGAWRRPARHICGVSEANGTGAAPSRAGREGVGPQAVGCGLLLGSRGHPIPFAVIAQQAPCGRCTGRPAGAKRKRASPCGLALFEVRTLSRAALVGAPLLYHNQPLLSRPAVQFFGCR